MSEKLYTSWFECDGDCGSKIELTLHERAVSVQASCRDVAETLGWTTRDRGKKTEVYCQFCQKRAKRIVEGR